VLVTMRFLLEGIRCLLPCSSSGREEGCYLALSVEGHAVLVTMQSLLNGM
jgi:hypothetical protein